MCAVVLDDVRRDRGGGAGEGGVWVGVEMNDMDVPLPREDR